MVAREPHVETDRLQLFRWSVDFLPEFADMLATPVVMEHINRGKAMTLDQSEVISRRGEDLWSRYDMGPWAAMNRESGDFVGRIGMNLLEDWPNDDRWEVGFELVERFWGRGLAAEGARAGVALGFGTGGLDRIISVTARQNVRSQRVMQKAGLAYAGTRTWRDAEVVWYQVDRQPTDQ